MKSVYYISIMALLLPSLAISDNRIDCYGDANGFHTYLTYDGNLGEFKGRLYDPLRVLVTKDEDKILFKSYDLDWVKYYIDRSNGNKYSLYPLSLDPNDYKWVKIAQCELPDSLAS